MKKFNFVYLMFGLLCLSLASCQKMVTDDDDETGGIVDSRMVRFNVVQLEQMPFADAFASRGTDVKSVCSRISLALYQKGVRVKQINQTLEDENFGQLKLMIPAGTYKVVLIAHSGEKNPTLTNPERITFSGKLTDTFYYCEDLELADGGSYDLKLKRAVAMFRLIIADQIPSNVALMHFYYTGGSSTFDAVHGFGNVNSRQSELRDVTEDMHGKPGTFEVYTFPHSDNRTLRMQVTAHDAGNNVLVEKVFEDVEVKRNIITQYRGSFFGGEIEGEELGEGNIQLNLYSEDEWGETAYMY
jgi:hypothetical protein